MLSKFIRASIVILAETHNPSILSPDWLKRNKVITEDPNQFVLTPDFAVFDSKSFNLIVDRQRLQLSVKKVTTANQKKLVESVIKYVELLPHIPFIRLGLNFDWLVEEDDQGSPPEIAISMGEINDFHSIFPEHDLCFGSIIFAKKNGYRLRLVVEPRDENALIYRFNFEYNIKDLDSGAIKERIKTCLDLSSFASKIVKKTTKLTEGESKQ